LDLVLEPCDFLAYAFSTSTFTMSDDEQDLDLESDADKRAHHNALERKRRDHIKDSFSGLRDAVPSLHGEKGTAKASRAQILKKAAEYIQMMRRKNTSHQQDIDDLKKQNKVLEEQIRALDKAKTSGFANFNGTSLLEKPKSESISSLDGMSDSEEVNSDSEGNGGEATNGSSASGGVKDEDSLGPTPKRLKVSTGGPAAVASRPATETSFPKVVIH